MVLRGHVDKGVIILDENATLPDGIRVSVSILASDEDCLSYRRFRGVPYTFEHPFEPAIPETDWEAAR
ncbi:MAG: hypothetical protein GC168_03175 [Candidatus Hydrogenedens sp.]|nr:hypothetical protein [Candidatus Hydrogenedens sp.]